MAVKKHELVADRNQLDLTALAQYVQLMNDQPGYLPSPQELIKHCHDIVKCLARTAGTADQLWPLLQPVENFLLRVVTTVHSNIRYEILTAILDKFYSYISDPQSDAYPATAAVLIVLDESDEETVLSIARWMVERTENGSSGAGHRAALSYLYRWLHDWHGTPALGFWIVAYIKALQESAHYDILIETSLDDLPRLFSCMVSQRPIQQNTANVIFHVLASLRESVDAFDKISSAVGDALVNLASDSGQWSRQHLQDLVDILTTMVDGITCSLNDDAQELFQSKYADVIVCLERHMASRASEFLQLEPWRTHNMFLSGMDMQIPIQKVGLLNLGNTCYMNSVIQALFVTKQFSTHVMLRSTAVPYWEKMGELFAHMMHTASVKLDPEKFFRFLRPPFFTSDNQHDSSEFLSYLMELLQSYEHYRDPNFDYSRPPVLNGAHRFRTMMHPTVPQLLGNENPEPSHSHRSLSPRPGSSSGSSSSGLKRSLPEREALMLPPKKRLRLLTEAAVLRRDSFIDGMFGGVLLTRVQCNFCHASSLSRDVFRDLQLAFPEKPDVRQHSVQSLLEFYCSKESLSGDNRYQCRDCGGLRDAERRVLIETTPKYLILVLKHFKFDTKMQVQTKLMHSVYYNHTVTLPTVRTQAMHLSYSLFAAVIHAGTTLDLGHYYTLAKDNGMWHKFNDCSVGFADESHINKLNRSSTPYILFYKRSDVEDGVSPTFEDLSSRVRDDITADNKMYEESVRKRLSRP